MKFGRPMQNDSQADLEFSRLESWSRDPFLQVLVSVLVLEPQESWSWSWDLGLGTMATQSSSLMKHEIETK